MNWQIIPSVGETTYLWFKSGRSLLHSQLCGLWRSMCDIPAKKSRGPQLHIRDASTLLFRRRHHHRRRRHHHHHLFLPALHLLPFFPSFPSCSSPSSFSIFSLISFFFLPSNPFSTYTVFIKCFQTFFSARNIIRGKKGKIKHYETDFPKFSNGDFVKREQPPIWEDFALNQFEKKEIIPSKIFYYPMYHICKYFTNACLPQNNPIRKIWLLCFLFREGNRHS